MDLQGEAVVPLGVATEEPVAILLRPTPRGTLRVTVPEPGAALTLTYRLAGVAPPWNDGWNTHEMGNEYEEPSGRYSLRLGSPELQGTQSEFVPARLRQPIEIWPGQTTEVEVELARAARLTISAAPGRRGTPGKRPGNDERVSFFSIEDGTPFLITLRRNGEPVQTKWRTDSGEEVLSPTAGGATFSSSSLSPGVYDVQFQVRSNGRVGKPVRVELSPGEHAHVEMP